MKTRLTPIALLFLPLALSACGEHGGIGAGSSTENKVTTSAESKLDASREIKKSTSAKATLNMPATALVASALLGYANAQPKGSHDPHAVAAREILGAIRPSLGWPVACFGCAAQASWAVKNAARVNFADLVLTQLALSVQGRALADPQAARQAIVTAYLAMTPATLDAARKQAAESAQGAFIPDFSGADGVSYRLGSSAYHGDGKGWSVDQNGVAWFGDGVLSGQKIEIALDNAIDTGITQTSGTGSAAGVSQDRGNSSSADVK
jgi:uncharacterized protein YceK